ncbi:hypothetical protein C1Y63_01690 [Corynebacterium sp. 13CS0277]|uniref:zf-HC2 domain-containing protein n=1 Tax=Corynebacterium sp. 13CS0277 TaxID=2071994 RepID=UPI000D02B0D7|nr:zf-HC2 domain-containing protein [Corynebacterium sp. 13CS0277]PRQ12294.1 hypothetical protein C1Y63_01690 [Corynebacterium sp. 13CS0277]
MNLEYRPNIPPRLQSATRVKRFASVEHLSTEAVAAFVDGELTPGATHRAKVHLVHCAECRGDVAAQRRAAAALRQAHEDDEAICAPRSLVARLTNIAEDPAELAPSTRRSDPPTGPAVASAVSMAGVAKILAVVRRTRRATRRF